MDYRFAIDGYIMQNSAPNIGDITVNQDGKVTFKYSGLSEVDDGKQVMQLKNGLIYIYEDRKAYDTYNTGKNLTNLIINVKKSNPYGRIGEKFSITAMSRARQWYIKKMIYINGKILMILTNFLLKTSIT